MTVTLLVADDDHEAVTFTVSAIAELGAALHVLAEPGHHGGLLAWSDRIRQTVDGHLADELGGFAFLWRSYRANFLLPMRPGRLRELDDELREIADLPLDRFVAEAVQPLRGGGSRERVEGVMDREEVKERVRTYARSRGEAVAQRVDDLLADPAKTRERLIDTLHGCRTAFFDDEWVRLRPRLVADAQEKSDLSRLHGVHAALDALAPGVDVDRRAGRAVIDKVHHGTIEVHERGIQLIPSMFGWPHLLVQDDPAWPASIQYPVRAARPDGEAPALAEIERRLEALGDPARLRICRSIAREGRSTQELADIWGLTPPTVSRHLRQLREAGLVTTHRHGHFVLYRLDVDATSQLGADLLAALLR